MGDFPPADAMICARIRSQRRDPQNTKTASVFYRNLEQALDTRRESQSLYITIQNSWQMSNAVNFCSNDILAMGSSGILREEFLKELANNPNFSPGSGGSRIIDGDHPYTEQTELQIAKFHGAETALIQGSGYGANVTIWTAVPRLGDVILYDALVHASTHDGIEQSVAIARTEFKHNDVGSFRDALISIAESHPLIKQGKRCILVAVESVYSVDGDICPLQELVDVADELFPENGIVQFVVDEAHGTGIIGHQGRGLVSALGLEKKVAVRLHTMSKAMSSGGAVVLGNSTIRAVLINFARSFIFTAAPSLPFVAAIRAGYNILASGKMVESQQHVQDLVRLFLTLISEHELYEKSQELSLFSVALLKENWEDQPYYSHVVPIHTPDKYHYWLFFHLTDANFSVAPVDYPVVPKGKSRIKVTFHASNTEEQVERLVESLFGFAQEMIEISSRSSGQDTIPTAAKRMYTWMKEEGLGGYGM